MDVEEQVDVMDGRSLEESMLFYQTLLDPLLSQPLAESEVSLSPLFMNIVEELLNTTGFEVSSLYAGISFLANHYRLPSRTHRGMQLFRKYVIESDDASTLTQWTVDIPTFSLSLLAKIIVHFLPPSYVRPSLLQWSEKSIFLATEHESAHVGDMEMICKAIDKKKDVFLGYCFEYGPYTIEVRLDEAHTFQAFLRDMEQICKYISRPFKLRFFDVYREGERKEKVFKAKAYALLPDYLVDITSVAQCFSPFGNTHQAYFIQRLTKKSTSIALLKGNIVNYLLDRLVNDLRRSYEEETKGVFEEFSLSLGLLNDQQVRDLLNDLYLHFCHLKKVLAEDLSALELQMDRVLLEPSFYNSSWGLQGRLDMYFDPDENKGRAAIIELKSSRPFRPNKYGLSISHYIQTLLYEVLVQQTLSYKHRKRLAGFILYSSLENSSLKYAPPVRAMQYEALACRNKLLLGEYILASMDPSDDVLSLLAMDGEGLKGYMATDYARLNEAYAELVSIHKVYYNRFLSFVTRELFSQKVGHWKYQQAQGQSALWLASSKMKEDHHNLLRGLKITAESFGRMRDKSLLIFVRPEKYVVSGFRVGDAVIIYPETKEKHPLDFPVTKVRIVAMNAREIVVNLRTHPVYKAFYAKYTSWCLEPDFLDSSFRHLRSSLYEWMIAPAEKRDKLLGIKAPHQTEKVVSSSWEGLDAEKAEICKAAISSRDYYLIWGPPGTGKTSIVLKHLVEHLLYRKKERVLALAYTNRAVDEMCAAIEGISSQLADEYIRVGSHLSVDPAFRKALIQERIAGCQDRRSLRAYLQSRSLVVGTLASIYGKPELFNYLEIDTLILDEASQVLEPQIMGLLTRVKRFILIGDHKQLPAVVIQPEEDQIITHPELQGLGFKKTGNSFFERLLSRARKNQWTWSYGILRHQGRMHKQISDFVSAKYYEDLLSVLPENIMARQHSVLNRPNDGLSHPGLARNRLLFIDPYEEHTNDVYHVDKKSDPEAICTVSIIKDLIKLGVSTESIGVITAYRAQIANITKHILEAGVDVSALMVDTVERFQGGAKDVIIFSPAVRQRIQMTQITHYNEEGMDRKLNVVISRAREQVVIVGHGPSLQTDTVYRDFINRFSEPNERSHPQKS